MNIDSPTLDQVASAFECWRTARSKREPTPKPLIDQTLGLLEIYSKHKITRRLGINYKILNDWMQQRASENSFVKLTPEPKQKIESVIEPPLKITVQLPTGAELSLVGSEAQAVTLITQLQRKGVL